MKKERIIYFSYHLLQWSVFLLAPLYLYFTVLVGAAGHYAGSGDVFLGFLFYSIIQFVFLILAKIIRNKMRGIVRFLLIVLLLIPCIYLGVLLVPASREQSLLAVIIILFLLVNSIVIFGVFKGIIPEIKNRDWFNWRYWLQ